MAGIGAVILLVAWRKGHLLRIAGYVGETRVELRKCNWPTMHEIQGSTVLVMMSVAAIGIFTFFIDMFISFFIKLLMG